MIEELLIQALSGSKKAENEIFQILFARFTRFAKRKIQKEKESEDLAQEACMTVLQKYKDEDFKISFQAWAYGILKMKIGNYLQKSNVREGVMTPLTESDKSSHHSCQEVDPELIIRLKICMKKLINIKPRYARILNLIHKGYKRRNLYEIKN
ncbi:MAG: hypothetical protein GY855_13240 [candidate division Zixibacteria bacterium]|nr:hypothetical protein [candidate division Zixibacteria bacterium]